jgi:hypothetical protein
MGSGVGSAARDIGGDGVATGGDALVSLPRGKMTVKRVPRGTLSTKM